jgi:predicted alpha/beta hydrolase family esterase
MRLVYIHGAHGSPTTFNYIKSFLQHPELLMSYDSHTPFTQNLERMAQCIHRHKKVFFVAHSLGGVYALHLAKRYPEKILGAVTISTPYGGSREAELMSWFLPGNQLIKDIRPSAAIMAHLHNIAVPDNWCNIVTTAGHSALIRTRNDGVVTVDSMMHLSHRMDTVMIDLNHFEVVLSQQTVQIISERLSKTQ